MAELTLTDLRNGNKAGHSQKAFSALLERNGFLFKRETRHGAMYVHPALKEHRDLTIRRDWSWVLIPNGRSLPEYVANDVLKIVALVEEIGGTANE